MAGACNRIYRFRRFPVWVFWKFHYSQLADHLRTLEWNWVALAILFELAVYFIDAWRWKILLKRVGAPSFGLCLQAVFVGLLANDILPAKAGELVRCLLLSYETEVPLSLAITSDVILRIMDGLWIVILYLIVTFQISTHVDVTRGMWFFGTGAVTVALVLLVRAVPASARPSFRENHELGGAICASARRDSSARPLARVEKRDGDRRPLLAGADAGRLGADARRPVRSRPQRRGFSAGCQSRVDTDPECTGQYGRLPGRHHVRIHFLLVERANAQPFSEIMFGFLTLPAAVGGAIAVVFADIDLFALHRHAHRAKRPATTAPTS